MVVAPSVHSYGTGGCFDGCLGGVGAFLAFHVVWAVLVQNSFLLLLLLPMKLVISQKAW